MEGDDVAVDDVITRAGGVTESSPSGANGKSCSFFIGPLAATVAIISCRTTDDAVHTTIDACASDVIPTKMFEISLTL